ncbi:MAG: glycoside hydrolase family 10 protein, partial [Cyanobacteria bacterium P01_F01_bin.153]
QSRFQAELSQPAVQAARRRIPVGVGILTGTWGKPVPIEQVKKQVETSRAQGFDGVSFFYWESLWGYIAPESPRDRRRVFQELFMPAPS